MAWRRQSGFIVVLLLSALASARDASAQAAPAPAAVLQPAAVQAAGVQGAGVQGAGVQGAGVQGAPLQVVPQSAVGPSGWSIPAGAADVYNAVPNVAALGEARRFSDAFATIAERLAPSIVQVDTAFRDELGETTPLAVSRSGEMAPAHASGAGLVLSPDGAILTTDHLLDQAVAVQVRLRDGRTLPARVLGRDPVTDLALVRVDAKNLTPARFADSDTARVGEWVLAVGAAPQAGPVVTMGVLSARTRYAGGPEELFQTDATMIAGSSGGAVCDLEGRVLGIATTSPGRAAMTMVVPSNLARRIAEQLQKSGRVARPVLGFGLQDLTPELATALKLSPGAGVLVNQVADGGAGQRANLRPGDIVAAVAGKPVRDAHELARELAEHAGSDGIPLEILRDGKRYAATLALLVPSAVPPSAAPPSVAPPARPTPPGLGLTLRELPAAQAAQVGLPAKAHTTIVSVAPGSAAERAGIRAGDVLVEADGTAEPTPAQVQKAAADGELVVRVRRKDGAFFAVVQR